MGRKRPTLAHNCPQCGQFGQFGKCVTTASKSVSVGCGTTKDQLDCHLAVCHEVDFMTAVVNIGTQ